MKKLLLLLFCFIILAAFGKDDPPSGNPRTFKLSKGVSNKDYLPNIIIVKFKKGSTVSQIRSAISNLSSNTLSQVIFINGSCRFESQYIAAGQRPGRIQL